MNYYKTLANSPEAEVCRLATLVTQSNADSQIKLLSGPKLGLVMLQMQETVADSRFNAGELLVTEVRLELDEQFGFGMVLGDQPRHALALALVDAALRKGDKLAQQLEVEIAKLAQQLEQRHRQMHELVSSSKVDFETF